jgi:hypothetical protein
VVTVLWADVPLSHELVQRIVHQGALHEGLGVDCWTARPVPSVALPDREVSVRGEVEEPRRHRLGWPQRRRLYWIISASRVRIHLRVTPEQARLIERAASGPAQPGSLARYHRSCPESLPAKLLRDRFQ